MVAMKRKPFKFIPKTASNYTAVGLGLEKPTTNAEKEAFKEAKNKNKLNTKPNTKTYKGFATKLGTVAQRKIVEKKVVESKKRKQINFVVRVYIDEDYSKHKKKEYTTTKDASFYTRDTNGKYRQHIKQYKLFTHRAFFMRGNTKNIRPFLNRQVFGFDQKDLENFRVAISKYEGGDDFNSALKSWFSLLDHLMFVVEDVSYGDPFDSSEIDYATTYANDDNAIPFQTKYITHNLVDNVIQLPYTDQYVKQNLIKMACWYSVIIDTFKPSWDTWYKNSPLTYESLYYLIHNQELTNDSDMSLNFNKVVKRFFEPFKLGIVLFDCNMKVRCKYLPKEHGAIRNKHITPSVIYVMMYKNHINKINTDIHSVAHKLEHFKLENNLIEDPSKHYHIPSGKDYRDFRVINNVDDIIDLLKKDKNVDAIYTGDLFYLWRDIREKLRFECEINFRGNTINSLFINNLKYKENKNTIRITDIFSIDAGEEFIEDTETYCEYVQSKNAFVKKLLNKNNLSTYSRSVSALFRYYQRGGIIGGFEEICNGLMYGLDYNKYYTKQLMKMPKIPVINSFDEFIEYKGESIEDLNMYFYEKLDNELTYPLQKHGIIYGYNIKRRKPNVKLIAVLRPNTLKENKSKEHVAELYKTDLETSIKKFIVNSTIGLVNKRYNKSNYSKAFTNRQEAISNYTRYGGGIVEMYLYSLDELNKDFYSKNDEKVYFHYCSKKVSLDEGFYPIGLFIYDSAEAELFDLVDEARKRGMTVYGVNTDCIYVDKIIGKWNLGKEIGQLKIEHKEFTKFNELKVNENENIFKVVDKLPINVIDIENEWNKKEIKSKLVNRTILQAVETAGAGKTTALKQLDKTLFVIPFNAQREDLENDDKRVATHYQLLGLRINDNEDIENGKVYDITEYDNIVFDEIFLHNTRDLEKIRDFMNDNKDKKYYATGDIDQLPPIEDLNNIKHIKQYYKDIIYSLFPNHIYLYENKRFKSDEDRKKVKEITKIFLYGTKADHLKCIKDNFKVITKLEDLKTTKNLSAYNITINEVNKYLGKGFIVGEKVICRKPILRQGSKAFVNYIYTIVEIDGKVTLKNRDKTIQIKKQDLETHFRLAYCQTTHSSQGLTIKEPFTIFDATSPMATGEWLNTAYTRADDFKNITFFIGDIDFHKETMNTIKKRIQQLKEDDFIKKRDFDLDNKWVYDEIRKTGWRCKLCKCSLDLYGLEAFSIDRISNDLGHTKDNSQIICHRCNVSKK